MLKSCDKLSPLINLYYRNQDRHSSILSGILTIISYFILISLSIIFSLEFFLKKNPTSFFYNKFEKDVGIFPLNSSGIFHFIELGKRENFEYDNRIYSVIGVTKLYDEIVKNNSQINYDHWIYSPCSDSDINHLRKYLGDYKTGFINGLCIDKFYNSTTKTIINKNEFNFNYPLLKHGSTNINRTDYGIFIIRCQNHSEINKTFCYDSDSSDSNILSISSFSIYIIDQYIDVTNFYNPFTYFYNKISNQIVLSSFTINHLNFKPLELNTNTGIIFNKNKKINTFTYEVNEKLTVNINNSGIYGSFYFWMENQMGIHDRSYQKIHDICASISGLNKLIMIIGYILNYTIHQITLIQDLSKDIHKKTKKIGEIISSKKIKNSDLSNIFLNSNSVISQNKFNKYLSNSNFKNHSDIKRFNNLQFSKIINNYTNKKKLGTILETDGSRNDLNFNKKDLNEKNNNISCIEICKKQFCFKSNPLINQVLSIRMKVLSEEKIFTNYFILRNIINILLKQKNIKINNFHTIIK